LQRILKVPNHKVTENNHNFCYGLHTTATQFLQETHKQSNFQPRSIWESLPPPFSGQHETYRSKRESLPPPFLGQRETSWECNAAAEASSVRAEGVKACIFISLLNIKSAPSVVHIICLHAITQKLQGCHTRMQAYSPSTHTQSQFQHTHTGLFPPNS